MVLEGAGPGLVAAVGSAVGSAVADGVGVAAAALEAGAGAATSVWAGMLAAAGEGAPSCGVHAVRAASSTDCEQPGESPAAGHRCDFVRQLDLPQQHAPDGVVCVLGEHQLCPTTCRQHVFLEVGLVDALPDTPGGGLGVVVRQCGVTVEV